MADSHDNLFSIKQAARLFKDKGCDLVIHAGDIVAPFAAKELESLGCPVKAVFGNCDGEKRGLEKVLEPFGQIRKPPFVFKHKGLSFLITHVNRSLESYLEREEIDVLVFAHTHKPEIKTQGRTLLLNPGETGGWLSGKSTAALLNPGTLEAEIKTLASSRS